MNCKKIVSGDDRADADGTSSGEEGKKCEEKASVEGSGEENGGN